MYFFLFVLAGGFRSAIGANKTLNGTQFAISTVIGFETYRTRA